MITNLDRSGWVGASDIYTLISSRKTREVKKPDGTIVVEDYPSWAKFKAIKAGLLQVKSVKTKSMTAGDMYEPLILDAYGEEVEYGRTLLVPDYALRVNLDGNTDNKIIEVKTYMQANGGIDRQLMKRYYQQVQCQAFAWQKLFGTIPKLEIRSYALTDEDYVAALKGTPLPIDQDRLHSKFIEYDEYFVKMKLEPALKEFADWLNPIMGR